MISDIHLTIEKKTAYGWVLATTPAPNRDWAFRLPKGQEVSARDRVVDYLTANKPKSRLLATPVPAQRDDLVYFLDLQLTRHEGSYIFGDEPWFPWTPGTPMDFEERCHPLFAVLAGVENGQKLTPISAPRGLPGDACPETLSYFADWKDRHSSASHVSFAEFKNYPWATQAPVHDEPSIYRGIGRGRLNRMIQFLEDTGLPDEVRMVFWFNR